MLYQLSYEVKSLRVHDISELSLVPSISICFYDLEFKQTKVRGFAWVHNTRNKYIGDSSTLYMKEQPKNK
jgi:hypothetical protein